MDGLERPGMAVPPGSAGVTAKGGWKRALKGVAAAALRLHHYRFVRTRMLHDALSSPADGIGGDDSRP